MRSENLRGRFRKVRDVSEIMLDMDSPDLPYAFSERLADLKKNFMLEFDSIAWSRSTNDNWHCRIRLRTPIDPYACAFCQLFLGSDRHRELMNWLRIMAGEKEWNRLFLLKKTFSSSLQGR